MHGKMKEMFVGTGQLQYDSCSPRPKLDSAASSVFRHVRTTTCGCAPRRRISGEWITLRRSVRLLGNCSVIESRRNCLRGWPSAARNRASSERRVMIRLQGHEQPTHVGPAVQRVKWGRWGLLLLCWWWRLWQVLLGLGLGTSCGLLGVRHSKSTTSRGCGTSVSRWRIRDRVRDEALTLRSRPYI